MPYDLGYCRAILRGVKAYAARRMEWLFTPVKPDSDVRRALRQLAPDGIIAHVYSRALARALQAAKCPVLNVAGILADLPMPRVGLDNRAVGEMAADHLLSAGFRNFAFAGERGQAYSDERESAFCGRVERAGFATSRYHLHRQRFDPHGRPWAVDPLLCSWLEGLPRPVGIFACNDLWGSQLAEVCRTVARRVPEDVAIVGVDNDDLLCELARPSLSSVRVPGEAIGSKAAEMLDLLIAGRRLPQSPILLPPIELVVRQSSDVLAVDDAVLAEALRYIREHAGRHLTVRQVLAEIPVSRRLLERRFRSRLGRGIWEEIRRVRVERARALLAGSDLPIGKIANECGFTDQRHLSVTFREATGATPRAYRNASRGAL